MTDFEVLSAISNELAVDSVSSGQVLADLGIDSLDHLELVMVLEKQSGVDAPKEAKFRTVGALVDFFGRN
jgi:acyl carrier protein